MPFTLTRYQLDDHVIRLDVAGEIRGAAVAQLELSLLAVIIADSPRELVIDLHPATWLSDTGVNALVTGYTVAIEYGTLYRVTNAHHDVRRALQIAGVHDLLTNSDDVGALVLALLLK
jgi:anti-anti-sigma factor